MSRPVPVNRTRADRTARNIKVGLALVVLTAALTALVAFILGQEEGSIAYWGQERPTFENATGPSTSDGQGGLLVGEDLVVGAAPEAGVPLVTVIYDYQCSWCQKFEEANHDDLAELAAVGDAIVQYRPVAFLDGPVEYSTRAANAAAWVAQDSPEYFLSFHKALYANQPAPSSSGLKDAQIAAIAAEVGVPQAVIDNFTQSVADSDERTFAKWLAASTVAADESPEGLTTPMVFINGKRFPGADFPWFEDDALYKPGALYRAVLDEVEES